MENTNKEMNEKLADDFETFKFDAAPSKRFVTSHIAFGSGTIIEEGSAAEASTPNVSSIAATNSEASNKVKVFKSSTI